MGGIGALKELRIINSASAFCILHFAFFISLKKFSAKNRGLPFGNPLLHPNTPTIPSLKFLIFNY